MNKASNKIWIRTCPGCGKVTYQNRRRKEREHQLCHSCNKTLHYKTLRDKDPRSEIVNGNRMFFRVCPECNEKIFYKTIGHRNHMEKRGEQCRKCFRMDCFLYPKFNKKACKFFDLLNKSKGWNGRHALNGGEHYIPRYHYFLDYYEPSLNLVIEWNENHHKYHAKEDRVRQENIVKTLGCKFLVIDEKTTIDSIKT